ncbi:MAG: hypothetical protein JWM76_2090 [Pseudonocardiales bacterium]|nr:hypothetical protein [Pseudonocardiales bacterium]
MEPTAPPWHYVVARLVWLGGVHPTPSLESSAASGPRVELSADAHLPRSSDSTGPISGVNVTEHTLFGPHDTARRAADLGDLNRGQRVVGGRGRHTDPRDDAVSRFTPRQLLSCERCRPCEKELPAYWHHGSIGQAIMQAAVVLIDNHCRNEQHQQERPCYGAPEPHRNRAIDANYSNREKTHSQGLPP